MCHGTVADSASLAGVRRTEAGLLHPDWMSAPSVPRRIRRKDVWAWGRKPDPAVDMVTEGHSLGQRRMWLGGDADGSDVCPVELQVLKK